MSTKFNVNGFELQFNSSNMSFVANSDKQGDSIQIHTFGRARGLVNFLLGIKQGQYAHFETGLYLHKTAADLAGQIAGTYVGYVTSQYKGDEFKAPKSGVNVLDWFDGKFTVRCNIPVAPGNPVPGEDMQVTRDRRTYNKYLMADLLLSGYRIFVAIWNFRKDDPEGETWDSGKVKQVIDAERIQKWQSKMVELFGMTNEKLAENFHQALDANRINRKLAVEHMFMNHGIVASEGMTEVAIWSGKPGEFTMLPVEQVVGKLALLRNQIGGIIGRPSMPRTVDVALLGVVAGMKDASLELVTVQ